MITCGRLLSFQLLREYVPGFQLQDYCSLVNSLLFHGFFLCQYAMLKAIPNKNSGFIILLTSILLLFIFGEIRNITSLVLLNNNGFLLSFFFFITLCFLWIGAQFPQEKFLSYGRILTLHYYFLLMCILFHYTFIYWWFAIVLA